MRELLLEADVRTGSGKSVTRKMRVEGRLPAILYGMNKTPQLLGVNRRDLTQLLHSSGGDNALIDLIVNKTKPEKVLVKDIQHHPVTESIVHVDFLRVDLTKKVHISVSVHVAGTSEGVRAGGVLEFVSHELEVSCLPMDIPSYIEVNVTSLQIGDAIHVADIKVDKVEILTDKSRTVVTVQPPTVIKEAVPAAEGAEAEAAEGAESAEPEVITEKKKDKEEEEEKKKK